MRLTFFKAVALGAVTSMLTLGATAALAGTGVGAVFNLGKTNKVNATSTVTGSAAGSMLHLINSGTGAGAQGIPVTNASASAAAIQAGNKGAGPGGSFSSQGPAASFKVPPGLPPFTVNSSTEVPGLNAAMLDGHTSADFYASGSTVANSNALGGLDASFFQGACSPGTIVALKQVPASRAPRANVGLPWQDPGRKSPGPHCPARHRSDGSPER